MSTDSLPRTSYRLLVGIALGAMLAGSAALAQDPVPDTLFVERLDVDVINVEVFVTDRDGRRVADLAPDDFELLVDGQPAEISNFYVAYREDKVLDAAERGAPIQLTPEERPDEQRLHLMVYVDHYNMAPGNRKRVLDSLANFLEDRVGQGDRVMLAGFDGNFEVAQTFTDDLGVLLQGIDKLGEYATHRQVVDAERRWAQKAIAGAALEIPPDATSAHGHLRTFVQSVEAGVRRSAGALRGAVRSLGGLPGRKAVLYVGEGLARRPGEELYQHMLDIFGQAGLRQLTDAGVTSDPTVEMIGRDQGHLFQQVIQDANAHQVTLYSIDARGPSGSSSLSAAAPSMSGGPSGSTLVDATRTHSQQETLIQMATATGGATALGTFAFGGALDRMARDFDTYYSLGYRSPQAGEDGVFHDIEVRVKRPDLVVRHRTSFVSKPEEERVGDRNIAAAMLGLGSNPLGASIHFGKVEKVARKEYEVQVIVQVPIEAITLLPSGENHEGRLRFYITVRDDDGNVTEPHDEPYPVSIPAFAVENTKGRQIGYTKKILLRPGTPTLILGVWDELSGTESYIAQRVRIGA